MDVVFDCEVYPNCFLLNAKNTQTGLTKHFEISQFRDDSPLLHAFVNALIMNKARMVGFNSLGFDYPILHMIRQMGRATPKQIYDKAMAMLNVPDSQKWLHMVRQSDREVPQIDLFKIHHFDNKARMTSLKALEFNMRLKNISDLPFPPGTVLTKEQIEVLRAYCWNDVEATEEFYKHTLPQIEFREQMARQITGDVMNYSDVKLGKAIFQYHLERSGVECYTYGPDGRIPKQTPREYMRLAECVPKYVQFNTPEFERIRQLYLSTVITQTKGAFDGISAKVGGLDFVFGTGGIHASVENERFDSGYCPNRMTDMMILDIDVTGMYPAFAIENGLYPEHLGPKFVEVYRKLREQRAQFKKGSVENAALKLAMNGVYGASGDKFSIFYDPLFTMKVTVGGQLVIAMLAEQLLEISGLRIIQANTDGITMYLPKSAKIIADMICWKWEMITRLSLEQAEYKTMCIADVNSYIAQTVDGKVKRKGRYEYDVEWHQNASALVVPKIAEKVLLEGADALGTLTCWPDKADFYSRVKVPRSSMLVFEQPETPFSDKSEVPLENTQRFYASVGGGYLFKYMPPLAKKPDEWRRIGVMSGQTVCPCNNLDHAVLPIDYHWYLKEIEKLTLGVL